MSNPHPDSAANDSPAGFSPRSALRLRDGMGVFGLALGLRIWHLAAMSGSPFSIVLMGDSLGYDAWARRIAHGAWLGDQVFYQAPLYPYFLGTLYAAISPHFLVARIAQALLGALSCVVLALAAARFLKSRSAGIAAGCLLAVYAPAIFHDALIQKSCLDIFWLSALLWCLSRIQDRPGAFAGCAAGLSLGALTLTRENAGILLVPIVLWLWLRFRPLPRVRLPLIAVLLAGLAVVLVPVAARNYTIAGELHLTTSQFGPNFYFGNNANADGTYQSLQFARGDARYESSDATALAEQALSRTLDPGEVSDYWAGQALDYITSQPFSWLRLMGRKLALLLNASEVIDTEDQYTYAELSPALRMGGTLLHFGVISVLAALGAILTWRQRERLWILYLLAATYAASVLAFYVVARYRLPLVPFLLIFAAAALTQPRELARRTKALSRGQRLAAGTALSAFVIFCNWPIVDRDGMKAANYYNLATALQARSIHHAALIHYETALDIVPNYPEALWAAGVSHAKLNQLDAAVERYRAAIALRPELAPLHYSLADALSRQGDIDAAIGHYETALQLEPELAAAHFHLAIALAASERVEEGREHAARAVTLEPELLAQLRETAWLRATGPGVGTPDSPDGRFALHLARWSAELTDPATPRSLDVLAASYAARGRFRAAQRFGREALRLAREEGNERFESALSERLAGYEKNQPFVRSR